MFSNKAPHDTFQTSFPQEVKVNIFKLLFDDMEMLRCVGFCKFTPGNIYHIFELLFDDTVC